MALLPWTVLSSEYRVRDKWMTLRADVCMTSDDVRVDPYYVIETGDWAQVFALDTSNRVLVVRQYRHGNGRFTIELPSGRIDKGEPALVAAQREMREETGYTSDNWQPLGVLGANPARQPTCAHGFLARDVVYAGEPRLDPTEQIETQFLSVTDVIELATKGDMPAPHVACIFDAFCKLGWVSTPT